MERKDHNRRADAASVLYMDEPEKKEQNLRMAKIKPSVLLAGNYPRLIDE